MMRLPGSRSELIPTQPGRRERAVRWPLLATLALSLIGLMAVGLAGARPVTADDATMSPFVPGRHVYDYGNVLSANSAKTAETLASDIEARGGGRVVVYTVPQDADMPDTSTLATDWQIDGILLDGSAPHDGNLELGAKLKAKLSKDQTSAIDTSPGPFAFESWIMSSLARVDGFLSGTNVWDGAGPLDGATKASAEAAVSSLSKELDAPVYVDILLGGDDPSSAAFFDGAELSSDFDNALVIALSVSGTEIDGSLETDNSDLWDKYDAVAPWKTDSFSSQVATAADVPAALLADINAVHNGSSIPGSPNNPNNGIDGGMIFWIVFAVVMIAIGVGSPFYGAWLIRKISGTTGPIKGGLPGEAVIESITDTGTTVTMPDVGPDAPEYKFGLQVTPAAGGAPYQVEAKALVPRLYIPMVVPGAKVSVLIDPKNPMKVSIDFSRMVGSAAGAAPTAGPAGMDLQFDANGQPTDGEVSTLVGAVRSGSLPTIKGSADHLLATGTHGTAVITSAQPLGKTVRDVNPAADPSRLNDPVWVFTVEVSVAGEKPFPAVFGHRVPLAKLASAAPGVTLAVAVDLSDRHNEVAIDWDKSPIGA
jgi:hypothetical protein